MKSASSLRRKSRCFMAEGWGPRIRHSSRRWRDQGWSLVGTRTPRERRSWRKGEAGWGILATFSERYGLPRVVSTKAGHDEEVDRRAESLATDVPRRSGSRTGLSKALSAGVVSVGVVRGLLAAVSVGCVLGAREKGLGGGRFGGESSAGVGNEGAPRRVVSEGRPPK